MTRGARGLVIALMVSFALWTLIALVVLAVVS